MTKNIIIGLGNDIVSDDRIGIDLARDIAESLGIDLAESQAIHMGLLSEITGYDRLFIIDSIKTSKHPVGQLLHLSLQDVEKRTGNYSTHQVSLYDLILSGQAMGFEMPGYIEIYAVEINDNLTISEKMSPILTDKYDDILAEITQDIQSQK